MTPPLQSHTAPAPSAPHDAAQESEPIPPGRAARRTDYAESILDQLVRLITLFGMPPAAAGELLGISASTISRWKGEHPEFLPALLQARQSFRAAQLETILKFASTDRGWRAAAWLLERIIPEDFAKSPKDREAFEELARKRRAQDSEECASKNSAKPFTEPVSEASPPRAESEPRLVERRTAADSARNDQPGPETPTPSSPNPVATSASGPASPHPRK